MGLIKEFCLHSILFLFDPTHLGLIAPPSHYRLWFPTSELFPPPSLFSVCLDLVFVSPEFSYRPGLSVLTEDGSTPIVAAPPTSSSTTTNNSTPPHGAGGPPNRPLPPTPDDDDQQGTLIMKRVSHSHVCAIYFCLYTWYTHI